MAAGSGPSTSPPASTPASRASASLYSAWHARCAAACNTRGPAFACKTLNRVAVGFCCCAASLHTTSHAHHHAASYEV